MLEQSLLEQAYVRIRVCQSKSLLEQSLLEQESVRTKVC